MHKNLLGSFYLALAASIWGTMYVLSKIMLDFLPALELIWLRYIVALISLLILGVATKQSWKMQKNDFIRVFSIGIIGYFMSIWAQFVGTQLSSAQLGSVITSATPAFMVIFARLLLKERLTFRKGLSVCLATLGVLMIVGIGPIDNSFQTGGLILGIAALTWALMSILVKQVPIHYSQLVVTTYAIASATLFMTPFVIPQFSLSQIDLLQEPFMECGILYMGTISTAGSFFLWNKGLQLVKNATQGGLFFFFQPLVGTLLGWLFLGEQVGIPFWIGTALIISGVLCVILEQPKTQE